MFGMCRWSHTYLSSDSAGKPPHGFVRGVVLTSTPHLKGKRHSVSFNLKCDTEKNIALQCCLCSLWMFVQNSFFYLDKVFGPSCPQDTATAIPQSVASILSHFTTVGVGTSIDNQLKHQRIFLVQNIHNQSILYIKNRAPQESVPCHNHTVRSSENQSEGTGSELLGCAPSPWTCNCPAQGALSRLSSQQPMGQGSLVQWGNQVPHAHQEF